MAEKQGTRYRDRTTGSVVRVDDVTAKTLGAVYEKLGDRKTESASGGGYAGMKVGDLQAEIERRNQDREADDLLSAEGRKADLVAVLEADDAARAEQ